MKGVPHFTHEQAMLPRQSSGLGFNAESRRRLQDADARWRTKTILRTVAIVFSLIGFSLFASVIPVWDSDFYWGGGPNSGDWEDGFPLGVLVWAFLWNIVALVLLLVLKRRLKPWIPLVLDFLTWGALVPAITWSAGLSMYLTYKDYSYDEYIDPYLWDVLHFIGNREMAGIVFACFVWALEVTLFVYACFETHRWRKERKAARNQPSARALDHSEYVNEHEVDDHGKHVSSPPKYDEDARGIEMSPTSAKTREFV